MTRDERIRKMVKGLPKGHIPRHCYLASTVLSKLGRELHKRKLGYLDDDNQLFHILVPDGRGAWISLYCGGFSRLIEIQRLKKDGSPDNRYNEKGFFTPIGAANYVDRKFGEDRKLL